ncbi:MAG: pyrroline-5-carboxylate reductase [Magnetococcales bacterium]|nr:pyrroline-5-carboxylate reductase [Magnetococcales bacterium]
MTFIHNKDVTVAFAGGGNMAAALIQGLTQTGLSGDKVRVFEPDVARAGALRDRFGVVLADSNAAAVAGVQVLVVAVKPAMVSPILQEVAAVLTRETLVVSIAAGVTLERLHCGLAPGQPVIRAMPNTPSLIGAGVTVLCPGSSVTAQQLALAETLLAAVGEVRTLRDELLMDGVTALSGSGPAYLYLIIEALSDAGVACGLPRDMATWLAVHTTKGSAQLVHETGQHPGVLKNQVTSPGGTTIAAMQVLEEAGIRGTLMRAVQAAWKRSQELSRK